MKKIIIFILSVIFFLSFFDVFSACNYNWWDVWQWLNNCLNWSTLVNGSDAKVEGGFSDKLISWTKTLGSILSLVAVGWIVYWAFQLVISAWSDEKIKKGKDIIKWSILWFLALISAGSIIAIVVNIMYSLG